MPRQRVFLPAWFRPGPTSVPPLPRTRKQKGRKVFPSGLFSPKNEKGSGQSRPRSGFYGLC